MSILVRHFVNNPKVILTINEMALDEKEKVALAENVVLLYHQKLLTSFLERLEEEDKKLLIDALVNESQTEAIDFLRSKISDIESVVSADILELEEKILADFAQIEGNK